jgi:hypothetical protein
VADPKSKQVIAAVVALLEGITGRYAPDRVVKVAAFHDRVLDSSLATIISLSPDNMTDAAYAAGVVGNMLVEMPLDLALCRKFDGAEDPFNPPSPTRWDEQLEMVRAVKDALRADRQMGQLVHYIEIPNTDLSAENTYTEGWAIAFVRVVVTYQHDDVAA